MRTVNHGLDAFIFSPEALQTLLDHHAAYSVSIYMPSQAQGADVLAIGVALGQLTDQSVAAAWHGQIAALFARDQVPYWDTFDPVTQQLDMHDTAQPGDVDLVDAAIFHTLCNSGMAYILDAEEIPTAKPVAARLGS